MKFVDYAVSNDCINHWSYGDLCVRCGCCSSNPNYKDRITRHDVTKEKVLELRKHGFTIEQVAEKLKCGVNTVNRRLGMRDY